MNPPSVLLDFSFLTALANTTNPNHSGAVTIFSALVDDFVEQRCLLFARADNLAALANPDLFAPIDKLHIAGQHRNAAAELAGRTEIEIDLAITLVLIQRHRIRRIASFDDHLARYDVDIVQRPSAASNVVAPESPSVPAATALEPGAGQLSN
ncbi:MAG: hypothetical protein ABI894_08685 [Ilumatobacteraceae bacterium]